jgi:UDP-N-acetylglucosamine--N-acetylmuramyl-(pentapeptide) pyrophosphoryl-undecaprenol N-acetylglucosamine transferase
MAGGTGGHIFPGIAVAEVLRGRGVPVTWLGSSHGLENTLVPRAGIALETIVVSGVRGRGFAATALAPFRLARAVVQARRTMRRLGASAAISFGGFAAGPGGIAARTLRVPLLVHEQNRVPGMTNRVLARMARRVLTGFPDVFPGSIRAELTGNPVRSEIALLPAPQQRWLERSGPIRVLVLGGSQGARGLNRAVPQAFASALSEGRVVIRHQTGRTLHDEAWAAYARAGIAQAPTEPFIDDMASAYAWADLVVCRSGALTIAELCAAGVGAMLVPYPHAVDDHQTRNAEFMVAGGAARLLPEGDDLATRLRTTVEPLFEDREALLKLAIAARGLARADAAQRISDACLAEARS